MGLLDKLLGREKKDAGDMGGGASPRDDGMDQEPEAMPETAPVMEEQAHEAREEATRDEREG
jgi:hypothetical protein